MVENVDRRWSWLVTVLAISLAGNCLLAGYLLGHGISVGVKPAVAVAANTPAGGNGFNDRLKQLPEPERRKFQEGMRSSRAELKHAREELAEARQHLSQAMAAEPYDSEKVRLAFADVRTKNESVQQRVQEATALALASLSPESRKQLVAP